MFAESEDASDSDADGGVLQGFATQAMAEGMAKGGGMGIARQVVRQVERQIKSQVEGEGIPPALMQTTPAAAKTSGLHPLKVP